jgi:hypothetical protein
LLVLAGGIALAFMAADGIADKAGASLLLWRVISSLKTTGSK